MIMTTKKNVLKNAPPEKLEQLEVLRASVAKAESKGNFDTAHHEMLHRLETELGLIPARKTEGSTPDEVNDGESNL
jgi:tellurite resistance protein